MLDGEQQAAVAARRAVRRAFGAGANSVFDSFVDPSSGATYYVVNVEQGQGAEKWQVASRVEMSDGRFYDICPDGSGYVCSGSLAAIGLGGRRIGKREPSITELAERAIAERAERAITIARTRQSRPHLSRPVF